MSVRNGDRLKVLMVEPRGVRGINHYTYLLCNSLSDYADVTMATKPNFETADKERLFNVEPMFTRTRNYPIEALKLLSYVRRNRPDIVHYQMYFYWPFDLVFFRLLSKSTAKVIVTAHDVLPHNAKPFHKYIMKALYKPLSHIIAHDDYCKRLLTDLLCISEKKVSIVPMGNISVFHDTVKSPGDARKNLGIPSDAKVVLYFGVITERKGVPYLIQAFPQVLKDIPNAYLIIAGLPHKINWNDYVSLIESTGISNRTLAMPKHILMEEVKQLFLSADVVCLPYLGVYQSGVLQVAYTFRKPVVATTVGGLPDVIEDGKSGFLVPPGDPKAIADALVRVLRDSELQAKMSAYIDYLNETTYSWTNIAAKTYETYLKVLGCPLPGKGVAE
ncbi:MAG: glycosyltransferase family 4 protein [Armatimonadota bacterium]|nr:glycosyltransferase family 4 protein [Armatimonadota bacterium]